MIDRRNSFTAADSLPTKLLKDTSAIKSINKGIIPPVHVQFIPTNKCNLNCPFCSCADRDKNKVALYSDVKKMVNRLKKLGTKSVTITGGGEPLMHPDINKIINYFYSRGIKVGLVTNGLLIDRLTAGKQITWCRISNGDDRKFTESYKAKLLAKVKEFPNVDWAFSHVLSRKPNTEEIENIVQFANDNKFTHVRVVADLYDTANVPIEDLKKQLKVDDKLVIYQGRKEPEHGGDCYICYIKPLISADMKVYACCGVQYALKDSTKELPDELCLGSVWGIEEIIKKSNKPLNGNICVKCYYMNYNRILKSMLNEVQHAEFI